MVFLLNGKKDTMAGRSMQGPGYYHITVQAFKVDIERTEARKGGAKEGSAPVTLGNTARASFMTDPKNNWIEI